MSGGKYSSNNEMKRHRVVSTEIALAKKLIGRLTSKEGMFTVSVPAANAGRYNVWMYLWRQRSEMSVPTLLCIQTCVALPGVGTSFAFQCIKYTFMSSSDHVFFHFSHH